MTFTANKDSSFSQARSLVIKISPHFRITDGEKERIDSFSTTKHSVGKEGPSVRNLGDTLPSVLHREESLSVGVVDDLGNGDRTENQRLQRVRMIRGKVDEFEALTNRISRSYLLHVLYRRFM